MPDSRHKYWIDNLQKGDVVKFKSIKTYIFEGLSNKNYKYDKRQSFVFKCVETGDIHQYTGDMFMWISSWRRDGEELLQEVEKEEHVITKEDLILIVESYMGMYDDCNKVYRDIDTDEASEKELSDWFDEYLGGGTTLLEALREAEQYSNGEEQ